jgi:membrane peptidoglycan carboxypeptidase
VVDRYGREVYTAPDTQRTVISEATAYMMASMMSDVLTYGSAASARGQGVKFQAAGKTGTSQDYSDAWFVGFTPSLAAGVWFGYDKPRPIADRGFAGVVAVPAWARFMSGAMRGVRQEWMAMPGSLTKVRLCRLSGGLATDRCHEPVYEPAPFDPNNPNLVAATGTMREGGVDEDVMPSGRVPPPCTLPHGVPPPSMDPTVATGTHFELDDPLPAIQPSTPDRARPVTPPPDFMTERPSRVLTLPAATPERPTREPRPATVEPMVPARPVDETPRPERPAEKPVEKPRVETEAPNPIIPGASPQPTPPPPPADGPIVPGAPVEKAPPPPPRRPPQLSW